MISGQPLPRRDDVYYYSELPNLAGFYLNGTAYPYYTQEIFVVCRPNSSDLTFLAEGHWVHKLSTSPILSPFVSGIRQLDCMYLDTTFASTNELTREFPDRV